MTEVQQWQIIWSGHLREKDCYTQTMMRRRCLS
jgi:hypothetical protein